MIRKATAEEIRTIQSYEKYVQNEATVGYVNETNQLISNAMHEPSNEYFVFINNGYIAGWVLVGDTVGPFTNEPSGIILELFVMPQFRKYGIGKQLMNYAIDYLKFRGHKKVQLNVFAGNDAKKLYEKLGFQDISSLMEKYI